MNFKKVTAVALSSAICAGMISGFAITASAASSSETIAAWTSDFNGIELTAADGETGAYQKKTGTTIFGTATAAGYNDNAAKNAGLAWRMDKSDQSDGTTTSGISKVGSNNAGVYLVKVAESAEDTDYALGVVGTTASLTNESAAALTAGQTFEMSYDTYTVYKNSNAKTTTVTLKGENGSELISYTYTGTTGKLSAVKFGGTAVAETLNVEVASLKEKNSTTSKIENINELTAGDSAKNARFTLSVTAAGTAALSVVRNNATIASYTGQVTVPDGGLKVTGFSITNGSSEDSSRVYTIDNLTTTVTTVTEDTPNVTAATTYSSDKYTGTDKGCTVTFSNVSDLNSKSVKWYAKTTTGNYTLIKTESLSGTTFSGTGGAVFGLVITGDTENKLSGVTYGAVIE